MRRPRSPTTSPRDSGVHVLPTSLAHTRSTGPRQAIAEAAAGGAEAQKMAVVAAISAAEARVERGADAQRKRAIMEAEARARAEAEENVQA